MKQNKPAEIIVQKLNSINLPNHKFNNYDFKNKNIFVLLVIFMLAFGKNLKFVWKIYPKNLKNLIYEFSIIYNNLNTRIINYIRLLFVNHKKINKHNLENKKKDI